MEQPGNLIRDVRLESRLLAHVVLHRRVRQLVCWLAVCDIAVNLSFFMGSPSDGSGLCYSQGFLQRFFQVR